MTNLTELRDSSKIDAEILQRELSAYQHPSRRRSIGQLANTLIPYILLWIVAHYALEYSFWAALPVIVLASGFMIRTFIIFHDCGHRTFFRSRKANDFWGAVTGVLTFTPFYFWSKQHARHHATSGNLDKRGFGDIWMMTVDEYLKSSRKNRLQYRLYRNPAVMFLVGPLYLTLISHRFVLRATNRRERLSVYGTNLGILVVATSISLMIGLKAYLIIQFLTVFLSHAAGMWLFYVQHQFEGVYWEREREWDFVEASLMGGSFYKLPAILRWFTGSIGYHHVHHLNPRIPNYRLTKCHKQIPALQITKPTKLFSSLKALTYRLWDESEGRLVGFKIARKRRLNLQKD